MIQEKQLMDEVIDKAWADASFKAQLLQDPKAALKTHFGIELGDDLQLQTVEETPSRLFLVIPPAPSEVKASGDGPVIAAW